MKICGLIPRMCKALHYTTKARTCRRNGKKQRTSNDHHVIDKRCINKGTSGCEYKWWNAEWPNANVNLFICGLVFNSPSKTQDKKFLLKKFYPKINLGNNQSIKNFIYEWMVERIFYFIFEYFYFIQYFGYL